ncbi:MAG: tRNA (N6-isopentenyl adenosine(37)-C2)-methylthiotransferase MiaB [Acidobacteriota bacterium]
MAPRYFIETFGCQMNVHDSERLGGLLDAAGYEAASSDATADLVVVNTCSVREKAEEKLYSRLGEIRQAAAEAGRTPTIAVTGCVAQQEGEALLKRGASIDVVVGTQSLKQLPELVARARDTQRRQLDINPYEDVSFPLGMVRHSDPVRAFVTIIEGCNEFCAFCVVPYTRGHERMRPVSDILADVRHAASTGHREVQLLGQIVNHYQAPDDVSCDFAELLRRVHDVDGIDRLRFASPHPRHVSDALIQAFRELPKLCRHMHLPLQSGSDSVLQAMRRRHTSSHYLDLVDRLRQALPDIALSTDLIVGFPGETAEDFEATLDVVRRVRYHSLYSFKYSPRPNTLAHRRMSDDVPEGEKTRRIMALQSLQRDLQLERFAQLVGSVEDVLVDSISRRRASDVAGRTSGNTVVNLRGPAEWLGQILPVRITEASPNSLRGEALMPVPVGGQ